MTTLITFFRFFIFKNVFIGFCALALFETTRLLNGLPPQLTPAAILIFSSTILYYNFHDISARLNFAAWASLKSSLLMLRFSVAETLLFVTCILLSGWYLIKLQPGLLILFFIIGFISFSYSVPLIAWKGQRRRTREFFILKLSAISLCWAIMAVLIPLAEAGIYVEALILCLQFIFVSLFIFALCIPFEIRDLQLERLRGLRTIPVVLGIRKARLLGFLALGIGMAILFYFRLYGLISLPTMLAMQFVSVVAILLVVYSKDEPSDIYCKFYIDGMMILQFLLVFVSLNYHETLS